MSEVDRIQDQLRRAFYGEAWHGPSVLELLKDVTAEQAATRPIPGAHTIWELTLHIGAWVGACRTRLAGGRAQLSDIEDYPPISDTSEAAWSKTKTTLEETHKQLETTISQVDEGRLDQQILPGMPSIYFTLHGVIQHSLYHAGQIAILKKALEQKS